MSADHTTTIRRFRTGSRGRVSRAECSCGYFGSNGTKREAEADERRHLRETAREEDERASERAWWREAKKGMRSMSVKTTCPECGARRSPSSRTANDHEFACPRYRGRDRIEASLARKEGREPRSNDALLAALYGEAAEAERGTP